MVHNFKCIARSNGNLSVEFMEDGKNRSIIFLKDSTAKRIFVSIVEAYNESKHLRSQVKHIHTTKDFNNFLDSISSIDFNNHSDLTDDNIKKIINKMRKYFVFKKNLNNVSIFYPVKISDLVAV